MAYDNVQFPLSTDRCIPQFAFDTHIDVLGNGAEIRTANWDDALLTYDVIAGIRDLTDLRNLHVFHLLRRGRARSFPIQDLFDCTNSWDGTLTAFATGDGTAGPFQITRTYTDAGNSWIREITKPEQGTIKIYVGATLKVEGTHYTINYLTGKVTFLSGHFPAAAATISWEGRFYVPVRFVDEKLPLQDVFLNMKADTDGKYVLIKDATGNLPSILLIEDRAA